MTLRDEVREHLESRWGPAIDELRLDRGPMNQLDPAFHVLVWAPREERSAWTYATCGMSAGPARPRLEVHTFINGRHDDACVELLTMLAFFHHTGETLDMHHTVNFGHPWIPGSVLDHGFLSLPYFDGRVVECQRVSSTVHVRHLWLLPITRAERELKKRDGAEALEQLFESRSVRFDDPMRASLV